MSDYASKNDMMFFQDEVLGDIKKIENKLNSKLEEKTSDINSKLVMQEKKMILLSNKFDELYETIITQKDNEEKISKIVNFKKKTEESMFIYDTKINSLERDLSNAIYKMDQTINNTILVPGLIGNTCKYPTVRAFLDYCNKTFMDLNAFKDKNIIDLKKYKTKIESLVTSFNLQIENIQNKFIDYFNKRFVEVETKLMDRIKITDDRIDVLRLENGKYATELIEETKNLGIKWEKLDEFEKEINEKIDEEFDKFNKIINNTIKQFNDSQVDYKILKQKFTVLSDFIKDVRFRKNMGQNVPMKEYKEVGRKIDFRKKQILENDDSKEEDLSDDYNNLRNNEFVNLKFDEHDILGSPMSSRMGRRKRECQKEKDGNDISDAINIGKNRRRSMFNISQKRRITINERTFKNEKTVKNDKNINNAKKVINDKNVNNDKNVSNDNINKDNNNINDKNVINDINKDNNDTNDKNVINDINKDNNDTNDKNVINEINKDNNNLNDDNNNIINDNNNNDNNIINDKNISNDNNNINTDNNINNDNNNNNNNDNNVDDIKNIEEKSEENVSKNEDNIEDEDEDEKNNLIINLIHIDEDDDNKINDKKKTVNTDVKMVSNETQTPIFENKTYQIQNNEMINRYEEKNKNSLFNIERKVEQKENIQESNIQKKSPKTPKERKNIVSLDFVEDKNKISFKTFEEMEKLKKQQQIMNDNILSLISSSPNSYKNKKRMSNVSNKNIIPPNLNIYFEKYDKLIKDLNKKIDRNEKHLSELESTSIKKNEEIFKQLKFIIDNIKPVHKNKQVVSQVFSNFDSLSIGQNNNFLMTAINYTKKNYPIKPRKKINITIDANKTFIENKKINNNDFSELNLLTDTEPPCLNTDNSVQVLNTVEPFLIKKFTEKK